MTNRSGITNPVKSILTSTSRRAGRSRRAAIRSEAGPSRRSRLTITSTVRPESMMSSTSSTWRPTSGPSTMWASLTWPLLEVRGDAEAAQQVGREHCGPLEDHDHHQWGLDVGVDLGDLLAELAHAAPDALRADHCPGRFGYGWSLGLDAHTPTGCQTVFISMNAVMR